MRVNNFRFRRRSEWQRKFASALGRVGRIRRCSSPQTVMEGGSGGYRLFGLLTQAALSGPRPGCTRGRHCGDDAGKSWVCSRDNERESVPFSCSRGTSICWWKSSFCPICRTDRYAGRLSCRARCRAASAPAPRTADTPAPGRPFCGPTCICASGSWNAPSCERHGIRH